MNDMIKLQSAFKLVEETLRNAKVEKVEFHNNGGSTLYMLNGDISYALNVQGVPYTSMLKAFYVVVE